jgi:hypothetical protein
MERGRRGREEGEKRERRGGEEGEKRKRRGRERTSSMAASRAGNDVAYTTPVVSCTHTGKGKGKGKGGGRKGDQRTKETRSTGPCWL